MSRTTKAAMAHRGFHSALLQLFRCAFMQVCTFAIVMTRGKNRGSQVQYFNFAFMQACTRADVKVMPEMLHICTCSFVHQCRCAPLHN
jgi:hypothetical protein